MGIDHSSYVAYGVRIPVDPYECDENGLPPSEQVDQALSVPLIRDVCPDVGTLEAGDYDRDMFFLVTQADVAELGEYTRIGFLPDGTAERDRQADWDRQLQHVVSLMGWSHFELDPPGWFVVADCS